MLTELSQTRGRCFIRFDQHPRLRERLPRRPSWGAGVVCASRRDATHRTRVGLRSVCTARAGGCAGDAFPSAGLRQHLEAGGAEGGRMASGAVAARHHGRRHWLDRHRRMRRPRGSGDGDTTPYVKPAAASPSRRAAGRHPAAIAAARSRDAVSALHAEHVSRPHAGAANAPAAFSASLARARAYARAPSLCVQGLYQALGTVPA